MKWSQASYHSSTKVSHQKFIHYISQTVTYTEHQMGLNSQDPQPSPSQRPLHPAIKSKAKAKPIREVTPQDLADLAEDESWEPVQELDIQPEIYTEMAAMDSRLQRVRCRRSLPTSGLSSSWFDAFEEADVHVSSMCQPEQSRGETHSLYHKLHALVQQISKEANLAKCDPAISNGCSRLHLLEVFCHEASELTKQVQSLGGRAHRFGRDQGDLKTKEGRNVLFHIRCGNIFGSVPRAGHGVQSIQLCEHVQWERESQSFELALGIVLLRMSRHLGNHMHWEQPRKSIMFKTPLYCKSYTHIPRKHILTCVE